MRNVLYRSKLFIKIMKSGSSWLTGISGFIGNRGKVEESKSFRVGSPGGQNELPAPIGSPSEPIGDKKKSLGRL
jgi:hypothetical protein